MRYNLLAFLCAATVIAYLQRSALGVPSKQIEGDLGLTSQDMGLVWVSWYAGYAAFQIPSGWIADRIGSKPSLILFSAAWSALTALAGLSTSFTGLTVLWGMMGVAQAGIFVCATKAISAAFPKTEQAFASGALACCMAGGAALAQYLTGQLLGALSWQEILAAYAAPGIAWAVAFAILVPRPERPREPEPDPDGWVPPARSEVPTPVPWERLFTNRNMLLLCGQQFLRAGAVALFFTWFPRYLQETKGVDLKASGSLSALPLVAGMLGGLLGGIVSDFILRQTGSARLSRQGLATAATAVCAIVSLAAYGTQDATVAVLLTSVASFCGYAAGVAAYATAMAMGGKRVAIVFATMNMSGNVGASVFPYAAGILGSANKWGLLMLLFAVMFAGASACWAFLNPKGTLFEEKP